MMRVRDALVLSTVLVLVAVAGCGRPAGAEAGHVGGVPAPPADTGVAAGSSDAGSARAVHPPAGLAGVFVRRARLAEVSEATSQALDAIAGRLAEEPDPNAELAALQRELVAGVRAGRLDWAAIHAHEAAFDAATAEVQRAQFEALWALHDALRPDQRKAVVDGIGTMMAAQRPTVAPPPQSTEGLSSHVARRLEQMTTELDLDPTQAEDVARLLALRHPAANAGDAQLRAEAADRQMQAVLAAFSGDVFSLRESDLASTTGGPVPSFDREATFVEHLLPLLRPDQVAALEESMSHKGRPSPPAPGRASPDPDPNPH